MVLARPLSTVLFENLGAASATVLAAALSVAAGLALMAHERRDRRPALLARPGTVPAAPEAGVISAFRSALVWLLAALNLVLAFAQSSIAELRLFPDTPRFAGSTILLAGSLALLLLAVPFVRRTQAPLVALWPLTVILAAVAVLLGASAGHLTTCDVALAAAAPVTAVARESLLLGAPRDQRFVARAAMWFWLWPAGEISAALIAALVGNAPAAVPIAALASAAVAIFLVPFVTRSARQDRNPPRSSSWPGPSETGGPPHRESDHRQRDHLLAAVAATSRSPTPAAVRAEARGTYLARGLDADGNNRRAASLGDENYCRTNMNGISSPATLTVP